MAPAHDPYFEKLLKSSATFLARWRGVPAELWQLTSSHRTLQLVVRRPLEEGHRNLVIACIDPIHIAAPVRWPAADIAVARHPIIDGFVVTDRTAGVEIVCGTIEIKENVKLY